MLYKVYAGLPGLAISASVVREVASVLIIGFAAAFLHSGYVAIAVNYACINCAVKWSNPLWGSCAVPGASRRQDLLRLGQRALDSAPLLVFAAGPLDMKAKVGPFRHSFCRACAGSCAVPLRRSSAARAGWPRRSRRPAPGAHAPP